MSDLTDRINELRLENRRLKQQIEEFEKRVLALVGNIVIESSGEGDKKELLNEKLIELIQTTQEQLNIVTPKIDDFYSIELKRAAQRGIPILLITRDRNVYDKKERRIYDELKSTEGINVINNPYVTYLLMFNNDLAIYSGGTLDRDELSRSVLIITTIKEVAKIKIIAEIFNIMLPSFMR